MSGFLDTDRSTRQRMLGLARDLDPETAARPVPGAQDEPEVAMALQALRSLNGRRTADEARPERAGAGPARPLRLTRSHAQGTPLTGSRTSRRATTIRCTSSGPS
jgi:hypothetical protein